MPPPFHLYRIIALTRFTCVRSRLREGRVRETESQEGEGDSERRLLIQGLPKRTPQHTYPIFALDACVNIVLSPPRSSAGRTGGLPNPFPRGPAVALAPVSGGRPMESPW